MHREFTVYPHRVCSGQSQVNFKENRYQLSGRWGLAGTSAFDSAHDTSAASQFRLTWLHSKTGLRSRSRSWPEPKLLDGAETFGRSRYTEVSAPAPAPAPGQIKVVYLIIIHIE
jgi:hypothetical protein